MKRHASLIAAALLLAALLPSGTQAQPVTLPSTWGEYDLQEQTGYSAGLLALSAQSSSGFTALVGSNGIAPDFPSKSQWLPRVYNFFEGQSITNLGSRVTVSFDLIFNTVADVSNAGSFRFSLGDTNANNALVAWCSTGTGSGTGNRYDLTITQDPFWTNSVTAYNLFEPPGFTDPMIPTNISMGSFCDAGNNMSVTSTGSQPPNGVGVGVDTTTVHHLRFSVERTQEGLQDALVWSNSAGTAIFESAGAPVTGATGDDHSGVFNVLPWTNVNIVGFCLFGTGANEHFFGYDPGSYTVSNLKVYSGFPIIETKRDPVSGDTTLTWESSKVDTCKYVVEKSADLSAWTPISTNDPAAYATSYTDPAPTGSQAFYRVLKQYRSSRSARFRGKKSRCTGRAPNY